MPEEFSWFILFVVLRREEFYKKIILIKKNYKKTVLSFTPQNHINLTKFTFKMHIIYSYV